LLASYLRRTQTHWVRYVLDIHAEQFNTPASQRHEDRLVTLCVAALALFWWLSAQEAGRQSGWVWKEGDQRTSP